MAGFSGAFYLVTILATLTFIASTVIQPFFAFYVNEVVSSSFELGMIISLMSYTTLATRLPLGLATSKIGSWWVIPFALIGQSSSYILYSFATQDQHFYLIRIFHAIALASLQPTFMSLASILSPEGRKGEAIGIYLTSVGLAMMGGPLLCSFLLSYFNYRTIFILAAIIPLIIIPLYVSLLRNTTFKIQLSETTDYNTLHESRRRFKEIITHKPVQSLTYGRFTFTFTSSIITTLYGIYAVTELKIDPAIYALFFTLRGLANTVLRLPTGRVSDTIGRKKPLITSWCRWCRTRYTCS